MILNLNSIVISKGEHLFSRRQEESAPDAV